MALSADALTTVEEVTARLEDEVDDVLTRMIEAGIEEISDEARDFGNPAWKFDNTPKKVGRMCASAVAIWIRNPGGFTQSRASDETLAWMDDPYAGKPHFTQADRERLAKIGTPYVPSFTTVQVSAWDTDTKRLDTGYVPWGTNPDAMPFPYIAGDGS